MGNRLTFYEEFVMKYNESYQNAARAQNKVVKEAATLSARSLTELTNKRKCHELNSSRPHATNSQKLGTHYPEPELQAKQVLLNITLGSYVCVKPDLSPGMCSYEGSGFITDVNGDGVLRMFTVKYDKSGSIGGKTEAGIPYSRLIRIPSPFGSPKLVRERRRAPITPQLTSIQEILAAGAARGKHKNWRAKELGVVEHGNRNEHFQNLLREDTKELVGFLSTKSTSGTGGSTRHNKKGRDGRFTKRATKNNPHTIAYLVTGHGGDPRSGENNDFQAISALLWHLLASKLGVKKVS